TGNIARGCNPSFIVLIPKKADPLGFSDYRPISLIGCVYKVTSKILASWLAKVIASVISPNQTDFIAGRQILDGCLVANEIILMASIKNLKLLLFKVTILEACGKGFFKEVHLASNGKNLSLLQYADDAFFFGDCSRLNAKNLIYILKCFKLASGLKINIGKSWLFGVGIPIVDVEAVASSLGCSHDSLPFIYFFLLVDKRMRLGNGWAEVINRFHERLSTWKAKSLSICRRLTLIKFCGEGTQFKDLSPRLYALDSFKDSSDDLFFLVSLIGDLKLSVDGIDKWAWSMDVSGRLKVKSLVKYIQESYLSECGNHHYWNSLVPRKVNICTWRASLNRLTTRSNLSSRRVNVTSSLCPFVKMWRRCEKLVLVRCPLVSRFGGKFRVG
ncbi:RNA-directed DNA polymerase, eukaryota, partial [Tanacetum coccineum]